MNFGILTMKIRTFFISTFFNNSSSTQNYNSYLNNRTFVEILIFNYSKYTNYTYGKLV